MTVLIYRCVGLTGTVQKLLKEVELGNGYNFQDMATMAAAFADSLVEQSRFVHKNSESDIHMIELLTCLCYIKSIMPY